MRATSLRPVAIVTGGSRGIGAATVLRLARAGHDLVLTYRTDAAAAARVAASARESGAEAVTVCADVVTDEGVEAPFAAARERFGRLDAVVCNAGTTTRFAPLAQTPPEEIRRTIDVNLTATVLTARLAVQEFERTATPGVIVTVSSGAATLGSPGEYTHYAAAKAAVDAFTMGLGKEVGPRGIRVVGVAPGLVDTDLHARTGDADRIERMAPGIPLQRAADPDEIAAAIEWLLSPDASYVTATTLRVAGGR
ncbi:SDR family NAD(P)-dependent oxidoreductase [Humibacter ginsenosidimutans]|uniref:SDR family oxidoreductase n=1 Tax=Humibacter ginsenosidimutans TaxID=2599293 RepID=A0A5B8M4R5_9MICO|nr:SDR family oxidoreductase [Humibacter ginsenosidimutans]QDZ15326.1 SDR family oxidoreductase [Humibacter ginsenosidimutans]